MFLSGMVGTASGGTEKKYKITSNLSVLTGVLDSASPGDFVSMATGTSSFTIRGDSSGNEVPKLSGEISTYAAPDAVFYFYFVMPAEDVTIS